MMANNTSDSVRAITACVTIIDYTSRYTIEYMRNNVFRDVIEPSGNLDFHSRAHNRTRGACQNIYIYIYNASVCRIIGFKFAGAYLTKNAIEWDNRS